jgi:hypothetical protein
MTVPAPSLAATAEARERAAGFLAAAVRPDGLWEDFETLAGTSVDWVSGFVLDRLGAGQGSRAGSAVTLVRRQRPNGGWAYNSRVPTDADSTAWVLAALAGTSGWRPSTVLRGARYLLRHQRPDGGFVTYDGDDQIERYLGVEPAMVVGWQESHASVTAAALYALLRLGAAPDRARTLRAVHNLHERRCPDGLWRCYWWRGEAYPTWLATRALLLAGALSAADRHQIAGRTVELQCPDGGWADHPDGSADPWATACWLLTLQAIGVPGARFAVARAAGTGFLVRCQRPDGSWSAGPILRIPAPMARTARPVGQWRVDGLGTGVLVSPHARCFVTAQATRALQATRPPDHAATRPPGHSGLLSGHSGLPPELAFGR